MYGYSLLYSTYASTYQMHKREQRKMVTNNDC